MDSGETSCASGSGSDCGGEGDLERDAGGMMAT
jgi:hypothetical protein